MARTFRGFAIALILLVPTLAFAQMPTPRTPWTPPLGIPAPPFGITQVAGPATYYVDNTHPSATDTSNPNGTPTRPRRTVPTALPAGAVVEVHGGPYPIGYISWFADGTSTAPVFIKGVGLPIFRGVGDSRIAAAGSNFIIEGIVIEGMPLVMSPDISRFVFRRSILRNYSPGRNGSALAIDGSDVVIFGNEIHNNGDPSSPVEIDNPGVFALPGAERAWIVDNHIHHNGGDAVLVGAVNSTEPWARYVYIGRNSMHEDRENGIDVKASRDVIMSQNIIYGYVVRSSSQGEAIVVHNGPERVWAIGNFIGSSNAGLVCTGANGYAVVGNVVTNIRHNPEVPYDPANIYNGAAILTYNTTNSVHVNNTVWGNDAGISYASSSERTEIVNNIVAGLLQPSQHIGISSTAAFSASTVSHNVLDAQARVRISGSLLGCSAFPQCINADPMLADPTAGSFELEAGSPAIDRGTTHAVYAAFRSVYGIALDRDAADNPRPLDAYDIGALEFQAGAPAPPRNLRIIR